MEACCELTGPFIRTHGLTKAELDAMGPEAYAKLYENGATVLSVDVLCYLQSRSSYLTPSIGSIKVYTRPAGAGLSAQQPKTFAVKSQDFDATQWRRVNKLYPLERGARAFDARYLIAAGGDYYQGTPNGALTPIPNPDIELYLNDPGTNWAQLIPYSMSADQLRALTADTLTNTLAGQTFSVLYAIRVPDTSTVGYTASITADFAQRQIQTTGTVTLEVTMTSGEKLMLAGVDAEVAENFLEWLHRRQYGMGLVFYRIDAVGSGGAQTTHFLNYFAIQSAYIRY